MVPCGPPLLACDFGSVERRQIKPNRQANSTTPIKICLACCPVATPVKPPALVLLFPGAIGLSLKGTGTVFHERPVRSDAWLSCVGPGELAPDLENCAYRSPNNGSLAARWLRGRSSPLEFSTMLNCIGNHSHSSGLGWDPKAVAHAVKRLNHITAIVNRSEFPA